MDLPHPDRHLPHLADVVPSVLAAMGVSGFDRRIPLRGGLAVAAGRDSAVLVRSRVEPLESALIGHHGSLTSAEQHVPLLLAYG